MGGGWDTGSDESAAGRGGMREFERSSAEHTRRALLENDAELCKPTQHEESDYYDGSNDSADEGEEERQRALRYVPGDPFANEEADTDAWARHFTYLSIFPSKSLSSSLTRERGNRGIGCNSVRPGFEEPEGVNPKGMAAGNDSVEDEVILASHGVYEEYLAYDCRPPEEDNEGGGGFMKEATKISRDPCATEPQRCSNKPGTKVHLSTPQRALREEIMDRLFDKLWERLTPDLLNLVDKKDGKERRDPVLTESASPKVIQSDSSSKFEISGARLQAGIVDKDMEL